MTVSVAIATYNRATMVRQAVQAALAQTRGPDEIVVFDDASSDESWETLTELARLDQRIKIFRHATNTGGVGNWNAAISATHGEFIAWCSDDDRFEKRHLEASVAHLQKHPNVGVVHSGFADCIELAPGQQEICPRPLRSKASITIGRENLLWYITRYYNWPFHPSTIVMRRCVWETVGPFNARYALADTDWFVRAAERYSICLLPRCGVINRRHPGNWSNRLGSARMQAEILEIVERAIERRWPKPSLKRAVWRAMWRATVRLHLVLTLRARIRCACKNPALSAWRALATQTGMQVPKWLFHAGERWILRSIERSTAVKPEAREQVSPL